MKKRKMNDRNERRTLRNRMKMKKEIRWTRIYYSMCSKDWKIHTSNEVYTGACMNTRWAVGVSGGGGF